MSKADTTLTREKLEAVVDALVEVVGSWNDAAQDEDLGRSNDLLILTLADDGSGSVGRRRPDYLGPDGQVVRDVEDWHEFADVDGLVRVLRDEGIEVENGSS